MIRSFRRLAIAASTVLAATLAVTIAPSASAANPVVQNGDILIVNHSFESGVDGWRPSNGQNEPASKNCQSVLTTDTSGVTDGTAALLLAGKPPCVNSGAVSTPVPVSPGMRYSVFVSITSNDLTSVGVRWYDQSGTQIGFDWTDRSVHHGVTRFDASAPNRAATAAIELGAHKTARFDNVLFTAAATSLGTQIRRPTVIYATTAGRDENGRPVIFGVGEGQPGYLMQIDIQSHAVVRSIPIPGAAGGWTVAQAPDGTVYVGTYRSASLYSWHFGDPTMTKIGMPSWGQDVIYGLSIAPDGTVYGGMHSGSGGRVFKYVPGEGVSRIGPANGVVPGLQYTRSVAYEPTTKTVFAGTGVGAHVMGCTLVDTPCTDLIGLTSPEVRASNWVYGMTASPGYVMAWIGPAYSDGRDHLVIFKVARDEAGQLTSSVVGDIKGVVFNGSSTVYDGKVYYTKADIKSAETPPPPACTTDPMMTQSVLYSFDLATGTETKIDTAPAQIAAREWDFIDLGDAAWPGETLIGMDSNGVAAQYDPQTGRFVRWQASGLPSADVTINSMVAGPDGRIWTNGYLTGGLGAESPMRSDRHVSFGAGGQAEAMTVLGDRIYQGVYPGATIRSFNPSDFVPGDRPVDECNVPPTADPQDRPYGMLGYHGRIYYGSQADYGKWSGAFGVFDPVAKTARNFDIVGQQSVVTIAGSGSRIFAGTTIFGGTGTGSPVTSQARVLGYDEATDGTFTVDLPISNIAAVGAAETGADGTVWFYAQGWLFGLNPQTLEWVYSRQVFPDLSGVTSAALTRVGSTIYGNSGGRVFAFDSVGLTSGAPDQVRVLFNGASNGGIAADVFGNIYVPYQSTGMLRLVP
ncbi:MAG: hypothetical protein BGO26_09215 [Actinobacteria bacterium 69-20]|jgi:hypothetical protein|nr:hypothetical protein [Actinomycetota bacterium]OJV23122.1 MAG: hypothetical protein BGO26_09215 [Actinobacteria bacterium 69-20]